MIKKIVYVTLFLILLVSCKEKQNFVDVKYLAIYEVSSIKDKKEDFLIARLPKNYKHRQKIINSKYSIKPDKIYLDGDDKLARFNINKNIREITVEYTIRLYEYDILKARSLKNNFKRIDKSHFLMLNEDIPKEYIDVATSLKSDTIDKTIMNIIRYVNENILYEPQLNENSGIWGLRNGVGDCTEFSQIFATFCKINKIPSRVIYGLTLGQPPYEHKWCEVYYDELGWIPIETLDLNKGYSRFPKKFKNEYIYMGYDTYEKSYNYGFSKGLIVQENLYIEYLHRL